MKIIFYPKNKLVKEIIPPPTTIPIPQWFKDIPAYHDTNSLLVENGKTNYTVKSCVPFLDSFLTGYTLNLWCDIQVKYLDKDSPRITWLDSHEELSPVVSRRDALVPTNDSLFPLIFSWVSQWGIQTPKGYSSLFTHPLNRMDLPFITTSGIMDTDKWGVWGNQPFALKKGWEGVIPAGTPIIQVIPFKREDWKSEINESLSEWGNYEDIKRNSLFRGYYKKKYWSKKKYE